jgi:Holliday junction resolvase
MNTRAKGLYAERKAASMLREQGYEVIRPTFSRFGDKDFFNLWDIIAVKKDDALFVQVKSNKSNTYGKALDEHRAFECPPCIRKQCWVLVPRKPLEIIEL